MPYRFLPDVAIADVAFSASSRTLFGLFEASAKALTEVMVDTMSLRSSVERRLEIKSVDRERLLYDFLTELIVLKDVESLLFKEFKVTLSHEDTRLSCKMKGELINRERHTLRNDVKAVTMHMFGITRTARGWKATVVLDI